MESLTEQERKILDALTSFQQEKGYSPSQRELAKKVGVKSPNTVDYHLTKLEKKGYIRCPRNRLRAVELVSDSLFLANSVRIPVLGTVPAGVPSLALEEYDEFIDADRSIANGNVFGLKVKGESMRDAHIIEGDIVVVKVQPTAENGDIVVARFQDEATVKYFHRKKDGVYLVPANEKYRPIPAREAQIIGKVTGVIRRYAGSRS